MGFVDLHAHFLPALDDGAPDPTTTLAMLKLMASVGYEHVTATPHQKAAQFLPTAEAIRSAYQSTCAAAAAAGLPLTFHLAAENFWDHVFFERSRDGSFPRYDEGKAFLFEIPPPEIPARFDDSLFELSVRGFLPVMAHPERYAPFHDDPDRLVNLAERCALVVDLGALAGYHGWRPGRVARRLVADRVAHAVASDVHSVDDVRSAAEGIAWIRKKLGPEAVTRLCDENPRRILAGELPEA
jgi:protein-tyrosine phosphatase